MSRRERQADHSLPKFLNGIRANTLEFFEIISHSNVGPESFLALNCHQDSLLELRLSSLRTASVVALSMLKGCTSLKLLHLEVLYGTIDLESVQNDAFLEIIAWLRDCKRLQDISLKGFSGPAILTPLLLENHIRLQRV